MRTSLMFRSIALGLVFAVPLILTTPAPAAAQLSIGVGVVVNLAPPELPVYEQPVCPGEGYIWVPGYWAWDGEDYYWVPGTWVEPPEAGFFWTPGYWAWNGDGYIFTAGYWGPVVGFYGGIDYGFGYFGRGYVGGRWEGRHFYYNRAVNNVNVTVIHNTYVTRVNQENVTRVSFNGGHGGIEARATAEEEAAAHERHVEAVSAQRNAMEKARDDRSLRASVNHGAPPVAATPKPGDFKASGAVRAREAGAIHEPAARAEERGVVHPQPSAVRPEVNATSRPAVHPRDLPPIARPTAPNTGNPKLDQKYVQQQQKLEQKQEKDRMKLEQQQEKQDQKMAREQADAQKRQQMEMKHQQQTQQMAEKHHEQMRTMERHQQPRPQAHPAKPPHPQPPHPQQ